MTVYLRACIMLTFDGLADEVARAALREFQTGLQDLYGGTPSHPVVYGSDARDKATEDPDLDGLLRMIMAALSTCFELSLIGPSTPRGSPCRIPARDPVPL